MVIGAEDHRKSKDTKILHGNITLADFRAIYNKNPSFDSSPFYVKNNRSLINMWKKPKQSRMITANKKIENVCC